jgi:hypothetical protein
MPPFVTVNGPQLTFEPLELLIFNADPVPDLDPDLAFRSNANPEPASMKNNNVDACRFGYGCATLLDRP